MAFYSDVILITRESSLFDYFEGISYLYKQFRFVYIMPRERTDDTLTYGSCTEDKQHKVYSRKGRCMLFSCNNTHTIRDYIESNG